MRHPRLIAAFALSCALATTVSAQRGGGAPAGPPQTPQASAPIDLTGYWVAIVNDDWRWRMVTPPKGDYASVPISPEGRKVADTWDTSKDGSCLAFGAAGLMRMPTRLHITWENDNTLKVDTDNGQQTRRLVFNKSMAPPSAKSLQGFSVAEWERPAAGRGGMHVGMAVQRRRRVQAHARVRQRLRPAPAQARGQPAARDAAHLDAPPQGRRPPGRAHLRAHHAQGQERALVLARGVFLQRPEEGEGSERAVQQHRAVRRSLSDWIPDDSGRTTLSGLSALRRVVI
jgi:hypothetical protein